MNYIPLKLSGGGFMAFAFFHVEAAVYEYYMNISSQFLFKCALRYLTYV